MDGTVPLLAEPLEDLPSHITESPWHTQFILIEQSSLCARRRLGHISFPSTKSRPSPAQKTGAGATPLRLRIPQVRL
ncbi:hypothetical protein E2P81_ATG00378 [Venturia nashicola]|uniref:Uncharacterized protein n=1 Tax=Venturia nashicola TaxID=86259 RepID=A0A4Z1PDN3_9PEZI|nr:hypothetical protein E6O75_ATG00388 [Venturia nashicola]TLD39391.1 hypothetical protein E2P81_ATG00378 [Venturia nashicola]